MEKKPRDIVTNSRTGNKTCDTVNSNTASSEINKKTDAVNGTHYDNPEELEVTTLENAIYMNMKNDVSCILDMRMNLYEHQSTINPNIPLRDLFYTARLYENIIIKKDIYSSKRIMLPAPKFITFYNGVENQPERGIMRLSDSYVRREEINLELTVVQLNINAGYNEELKQGCPALYQYMQYVEKVRTYKELMPIEQAVRKSVDECIEEGILKDFLIRNKAEAVQMSIFEYDEELHKKTLREEGYEEGLEQGVEQGLEQGLKQGLEQGLEQGLKRGKAEGILELLEDLGNIPEDLRKRILSEKSLEVLKGWHKIAAKAESLETFQQAMGDWTINK